MRKDIEYRVFGIGELRAEPVDGEGPRITGHAAMFNVMSKDLGRFRETIEPGAFAKTIKEADIRALWNHNSDYVLGRNKAETLRLWEDGKGLGFEITPPDTQWANDALVTMRRGDVNQMSFGFETVRDEFTTDQEGNIIRHLKEVRLYDVSPVTYPAYPQTTAEVRARVDELITDAPGVDSHPSEEAEQEKARARLAHRRRLLEIAELEL